MNRFITSHVFASIEQHITLEHLYLNLSSPINQRKYRHRRSDSWYAIPSLSTATATQHNNNELPARELSGLFILILQSPLELFALQTGYVCQSRKVKQALTEQAYFQNYWRKVGVRNKVNSRLDFPASKISNGENPSAKPPCSS